MDKVQTIGIYKVLRVLPTTSKQHVCKVKDDNQIFRLSLAPLLLPAQLTPSQSERICQLLQKCSKYKELNHPNLETITDIFHHQEGADHFLAIVGQYSTEGDLEDFIQDDNTARLAEMKKIMIELGSAVQYLHNHSIIHCNITPQNIRKVGGKYKITFPSFKEITWFNRRNKKIHLGHNEACNQYYKSPQLHSQAYFSQSTDVWSMGIIFYEMLSGKQFRLIPAEPKLPCQMGNFTDQMLTDVPNYMMRSLLKQMLTVESASRIRIDRVKNILINTDISIVDQQMDEQIVDTSKYHNLSLSIFSISNIIEGQNVSSQNGETEMDFMEFSLDNFKIVLICKHESNSLQICAYNSITDHSVLTQYSYHQLPIAFSEIFTNVSKVFNELRRETLRATNINVYGEILFSLEEERYRQLKETRQTVLHKGDFDPFNEPSTLTSTVKTNGSDENAWFYDMKNENEEEMPYGSSHEFDDIQIMEKSVTENEKFLENRLKSTSYEEKSILETYLVGFKLSTIYFQQQHYGRCMQHAQKMFNYLSTFIHRPYITEFVSKLITCNEILNEEEQVLKWRTTLTDELPDAVLPCYLYTLISLGDTNYLYLKYQRLQEYNAIGQKMKFYSDEVTERLEHLTIERMDDIMADRLVNGIKKIFKKPSPNMYKILFLLLTKVNTYGKEISAYETFSYSQDIVNILSIYSSMAARLAPRLYKLMQIWVRENMPEHQSKIFDSKAVQKILYKYYH